MGDPARELAKRFHFLRMKKRLSGLFQCQLIPSAFGDIPSDLCKSDQYSVLVLNRINHDMGQELRTVLAQTPALIFMTPLTDNCVKGALRHTVEGIFTLEKHGEMLADNLVGLVPLDTLRTRVPGGDNARAIQHIKGVVGHALDKQAELLLTIAQRLLRGLSLGQVACDLCETNERTIRGADGVNDDQCPQSSTVFSDSPTFAFKSTALRGHF